MKDDSTVHREQPDQLVPDPEVWREFGVTSMTGWRWDHDPELGFPPAVKINDRKYRSRRQLEEFKKKLLADALKRQSKQHA